MAHELLIDEQGQASMFYFGDTPWHGLGQELHRPPTAAVAMAAARLDWRVERAPLFYHASIEATGIVPSLYALVPGKGWRGKERPIFGTVTEKYTILQNTDAFAFFDPLVKKGYATYETAGALGEGERVWVLVKMKGDFEIAPDDRIQRYLLLSNKHDGHASVHVKFTPVRVVCQNTLTMATMDGRETFSVRHDPSLFDGLGAVADDMLGHIERRYAAIREAFVAMQERRVSQDDLRGYIEAIFLMPPLPANEHESVIHERRRKEVERSRWAAASIFQQSPRCRLAGDTLWSAYNAVTELIDHWIPAASRGRSPNAQLNRIWFGSGQTIKVRAFDRAVQIVKQGKS
jgi:phage/plasmid-like protein (TIGR03299 family)